jgi:hypothetical protein
MLKQGSILSKALVAGVIIILLLLSTVTSFGKTIEKKSIDSFVNNDTFFQINSKYETPEFEWARKYGIYHSFNSVVQTGDGGYILAGSLREHFGLLYKTDAFGNVEWSKSYGNEEDLLKWFECVLQTSSGGFIAIGVTDYDWPYRCNIWLVKVDSEGNEELSKILCSGRAFSIKETFDGGYIIAGDDFPYVPALIVKIDSDGNIEWRKKFGDYEFGVTFYDVVQASDGGFIGIGEEGDPFVLKTDVNGNLAWKKTLPSHDASGRGVSIVSAKDGGYVAAAYGYNYTNNQYISFLIKIDDNGTILWDSTVGSSIDWNYHVWDISPTSDGGYILAGLKYGGGWGTEWYCLLIKTDYNGNKEWEITFGKPYIDCDGFFSVIEVNNGGFVAAGSLIWLNYRTLRRGIMVKVAPENQVEIIKPKNALYIFNKKTLPLFKPLIIGSIDIEVDTSGVEFDVEGVEFYINGELKYTDTSEPYIWKWDKKNLFKNVVEAVAFSNEGERGGKTFMVRKFL